MSASPRSARGPPTETDRLELIRKRPLARLLGVNPWTINFLEKDRSVSPPICISPQIVCWRRVDVERWLAERELEPVETRRAAQATAPSRGKQRRRRVGGE